MSIARSSSILFLLLTLTACGALPEIQATVGLLREGRVTARDLANLEPGERLLVDMKTPGAKFTFDPADGPIDFTRLLIALPGEDIAPLSERLASFGVPVDPVALFSAPLLLYRQMDATAASISPGEPGEGTGCSVCSYFLGHYFCKVLTLC